MTSIIHHDKDLAFRCDCATCIKWHRVDGVYTKPLPMTDIEQRAGLHEELMAEAYCRHHTMNSLIAEMKMGGMSSYKESEIQVMIMRLVAVGMLRLSINDEHASVMYPFTYESLRVEWTARAHEVLRPPFADESNSCDRVLYEDDDVPLWEEQDS
jgi:DUF971 family protein